VNALMLGFAGGWVILSSCCWSCWYFPFSVFWMYLILGRSSSYRCRTLFAKFCLWLMHGCWRYLVRFIVALVLASSISSFILAHAGIILYSVIFFSFEEFFFHEVSCVDAYFADADHYFGELVVDSFHVSFCECEGGLLVCVGCESVFVGSLCLQRDFDWFHGGVPPFVRICPVVFSASVCIGPARLMSWFIICWVFCIVRKTSRAVTAVSPRMA